MEAVCPQINLSECARGEVEKVRECGGGGSPDIFQLAYGELTFSRNRRPGVLTLLGGCDTQSCIDWGACAWLSKRSRR